MPQEAQDHSLYAIIDSAEKPPVYFLAFITGAGAARRSKRKSERPINCH